MIDKAGPKANPISIGKQITQPLNTRKKMKMTKKKWIDDFTLAASLDLKKCLVLDQEATRPVPYRGRTGHILPQEANILQKEIDSIVLLSQERKMLLNPIKTKAMLFNPHRIYDFVPILTAGDGENIDVVEEQKILGNILRSDMKTISNTEYICKRAYKRMWILRRLKAMGCPVPELLDVLRQQVISICEGSVPYWGPMITVAESNMLERCLKTGLHIIYQDNYITFNQVLKLANMRSLKVRRLELLTRFSKAAIKNEKYKDWFCSSVTREEGIRTRVKPVPLLKPVPCRTARYNRSSLPAMTKLLSWHPPLRHTAMELP